MDELDRRSALALIASAAAVIPAGFASASTPEVVMWRDPGCGCCEAWADRVAAAFGAKVRMTDAPDMAAVKRARGVPEDLRSCHTAVVAGFVVEGHVPPADIMRLIREKPAGVRGLAVPGMPMGSPGMDFAHAPAQPFKVWAFGPSARSVFAAHG